MTTDSSIPHIRDMLTQMLRSYANNSILPKDVLMVALKGMEYYELYINDQSGDFKKMSLIQMLHRIIKEIPMAEDTRTTLDSFIDSSEFSLTLDLIISASKGKFHLNKKRLRRRWKTLCCSAPIYPDLDQSVKSMIDDVPATFE
jgi:hypothetical protein